MCPSKCPKASDVINEDASVAEKQSKGWKIQFQYMPFVSQLDFTTVSLPCIVSRNSYPLSLPSQSKWGRRANITCLHFVWLTSVQPIGNHRNTVLLCREKGFILNFRSKHSHATYREYTTAKFLFPSVFLCSPPRFLFHFVCVSFF